MNYFYRLKSDVDTPSRQAFSKAREKVSYLAFANFFEKSCEIALGDTKSLLYKGYRLFAVDGTSFIVGEMTKLHSFFGESTTVTGQAMCRISAFVDVLNNNIVKALVSPFERGERDLAIEQVEALKTTPNALFLFDRGYWSRELVAQIAGNGQKFLMRIQKSNLNSAKKLGLRIYSTTFPSENEEILVTNIPENEMNDEELFCLYAKRWGIETKYLELKARLEIDCFSGETANVILQDIYSALYISNLVAFISADADRKIEEECAKNGGKYRAKANRANCISAFRGRFVDICLSNPISAAAKMQKLVRDISKCVTYETKSKARTRKKQFGKTERKAKSKQFL